MTAKKVSDEELSDALLKAGGEFEGASKLLGISRQAVSSRVHRNPALLKMRESALRSFGDSVGLTEDQVAAALIRHGAFRAKTAEELGISRESLRNRIKASATLRDIIAKVEGARADDLCRMAYDRLKRDLEADGKNGTIAAFFILKTLGGLVENGGRNGGAARSNQVAVVIQNYGDGATRPVMARSQVVDDEHGSVIHYPAIEVAEGGGEDDGEDIE